MIEYWSDGYYKAKNGFEYDSESIMFKMGVESQDARIKELELELNQQRFNNKHNLSIDQKVADRIEELESKLKKAVEALEFYANMENWRKNEIYADSEDLTSRLRGSGGVRARQALEKINDKRK